MELRRTAPSPKASRPMPIQRIVINSSSAPTERWHWKHVKTVYCLMAKAESTITATTIGRSSVESVNLIVRKITLTVRCATFKFLLFKQPQSQHPAVNISSESTKTAANAPQATSNVNSVFQTSFLAPQGWSMTKKFTAATGQICCWRNVIQKQSLDSSARRRLILLHPLPASGHSHGSPSQVTVIVSSFVTKATHDWLLAVKTNFSMKALWPVKMLIKIKIKISNLQKNFLDFFICKLFSNFIFIRCTIFSWNKNNSFDNFSRNHWIIFFLIGRICKKF